MRRCERKRARPGLTAVAQDLQKRKGPMRRNPGRVPARKRASRGLRHQCGARQRRPDCDGARRRRSRTIRIRSRTCQRSKQRPGGDAGDSRPESGLHSAGLAELPGCYAKGAAGGAAGAVLRRDFALEPLARSGSALSRNVVGFARLRWNDNDSAAVGGAPVQREIGTRGIVDSAGQAGPELARNCEERTGRAKTKSAISSTFWQTSLHDGWVDGTAVGP